METPHLLITLQKVKIMETLIQFATPIAAIIGAILAAWLAAGIGASAYKKQKLYERKEKFYLSFLDQLSDLYDEIGKQNSNEIKPNQKTQYDRQLQIKMKAFLKKNSSQMMIYATRRFKLEYEKHFLAKSDVADSNDIDKTDNNAPAEEDYGVLIGVSILLEEVKKDLGTKSKSHNERLTNLAIYSSTNDLKEQQVFSRQLKKANSLWRIFKSG